MTDVTLYALGLLASECGELAKVAGDAIRFGIDTPQTASETARRALAREAGDVFAAVEYAVHRGVLDSEIIERAAADKLRQLLDPDSRDNLGRRLAP